VLITFLSKVKYTITVDDFIKIYFLHCFGSTTCFGSNYEPSSVLITFLSKVKYTITVDDCIKMYFLNCFVQRHVSALVMSHLQF